MTRIHETPRYRLEEDRIGFLLITRLGDGASVYLQGDDANQLRAEWDAIDGVSPRRLDELFNVMCDAYDDVMEST